jgi:uncharacterized protein YjeT (DUF2065 family)
MSLPFVVFVLLGIVAPGVGLQRWARVRADPALVLPLGAAQAAAAHALSLASGQAWLLPALLALSAAGLLRRGPRLEAVPAPRGLFSALAALILLLAVTQYRGNRPGPGGGFLLDPMGDQPLHAGITWELTLPWPPQVPGLAGVPLSYHHGADLVRAAALRWGGVPPYAPLNREEPTLWAFALMLVLAGLVRRLGGGPLAVALAPWTVLLTDFSFVCAAFPRAAWWSDVFRGNLLVSLAFTNPVVPALALALGALVALSRHEAGEGRGWLFLAFVQAVAVPWFKVFLGAQLVLALALAVGAATWRSRHRGPSAPGALPLARSVAAGGGLAAATGLLALPLVLGSSGERVEVTLAPLRMVRESLAHLELGGGSVVGLALLAAPWLVVSLGLRSFGVPRAWRALVSAAPSASAAAALALSGWPLGLLFHAAARDIDGHELPSATIYFLEQSGAVLWAFAALAVAGWAARTRSTALALGLAGLVALPSTIEFAARKRAVAPDPVPAGFVRALDAIARDGLPGDVVIQRPVARYPPLPAVLVGRRVVYERFTPYLTQFAPASELRRRHEALYRFFQTQDRDEALAIARRFHARYVCLYRTDRLRFDARGVLVPLHEEADARAYRIVEAASPGR